MEYPLGWKTTEKELNEIDDENNYDTPEAYENEKKIIYKEVLNEEDEDEPEAYEDNKKLYKVILVEEDLID